MNNKLIKNAFLCNIIFIILTATLFHFLFDIFNKPIFLAAFLPVNESIFEHTKLCFYPTIIIWIFSYYYLNKKASVNMSKWIISMTTSILVNIFFTTALYYIGSAGFEIKNLIYDISTLIIGTIFGQIIACHVYIHIKNENKLVAYAYIILLLLILFSTFFTYYPLKKPFFLDTSTNKYGINYIINP